MFPNVRSHESFGWPNYCHLFLSVVMHLKILNAFSDSQPFSCLFVLVVPVDNISCHHHRWSAANFDHAGYSWPLSSYGIVIACHTYQNTWHPFWKSSLRIIDIHIFCRCTAFGTFITCTNDLRPVYTASFEHACFNMHVKTCCVHTVKSRLWKHVCLTCGIEHVLLDKSRHGKLTNQN